jgi:hypothetical protein
LCSGTGAGKQDISDTDQWQEKDAVGGSQGARFCAGKPEFSWGVHLYWSRTILQLSRVEDGISDVKLRLEHCGPHVCFQDGALDCASSRGEGHCSPRGGRAEGSKELQKAFAVAALIHL